MFYLIKPKLRKSNNPQITQIAPIRPGFGIAECGRVLEVALPVDISESHAAGGVVPEGPSESR